MAANMPLRTDDDVVQRALQILTTQREHMEQARSTVQNLREEISGGIRCTAADTFVSRMDDWLARYQLIKQKFEDIFTSFSGAHGGIDHADPQAGARGGRGIRACGGGLAPV